MLRVSDESPREEGEPTRPRTALVFGARNLGRAVIETLLAEGWQVAAAARSEATRDGVRAAGELALHADVTDTGSVEAALGEAHVELRVWKSAEYRLGTYEALEVIRQDASMSTARFCKALPAGRQDTFPRRVRSQT